MLYVIALILVVLWLTGLVTSYTMGGLIHVLFVIAILAVLLRVIRRQNVFATKNWVRSGASQKNTRTV